METIIPKTSTVISALVKADFTTQWRNRRSVVISLLVPVMVLMLYKDLVAKAGGPFVIASSLIYGLVALGLMGYANSIARDRDKGIFQRLRVAPVPSWAIMGSRLFVQMVMYLLITSAIFIVGYYYDKILLTPAGYLLAYVMSLVAGAVFLSLGQMIVGLIKTAETVNSTSRLVFLLLILLGSIGSTGVLGPEAKQLAQWSPYGTVKTIMAGAMAPGSWNMGDTNALLATIGYILVFATIGIKKFKWDTK